MNEDMQLDPAKVLAIVQQEYPQVYELAVRRAIIEQQREIIAMLHGATLNGQIEVVA